MAQHTENVGKEFAHFSGHGFGIQVTIDKTELQKGSSSEPYAVCPTLTINSFGSQAHLSKMSIDLSPGDLRLLGEWLIRESENSKNFYKKGALSHYFTIENNDNTKYKYADWNRDDKIVEADRSDWGRETYGSETMDYSNNKPKESTPLTPVSNKKSDNVKENSEFKNEEGKVSYSLRPILTKDSDPIYYPGMLREIKEAALQHAKSLPTFGVDDLINNADKIIDYYFDDIVRVKK